MSCEVSDECEGDVMDIALATIRHKRFPLLRVGNLRYLLDKKNNPVILVGYGHDDPEQMGHLCHIIKFRISEKGVACYGVLSAMKDYAVKHTRVAKVNVKIFASEIPTEDARETKKFLRRHYMKHIEKAVEGFRKRGHKVNRFRPREGGGMSRPLWLDDESSEGEEVSRGITPNRNKKKYKKKLKRKEKKKELDEADAEEGAEDAEDSGAEEGSEEPEAEEEIDREDVEMLVGGFNVEPSPDPDALFVSDSQNQTRRNLPQTRGGRHTPE